MRKEKESFRSHLRMYFVIFTKNIMPASINNTPTKVLINSHKAQHTIAKMTNITNNIIILYVLLLLSFIRGQEIVALVRLV